MKNFSPSTINMILGNGAPYGDQSDLSKKEKYLQTLGYYLTDVGIIAVYVMFGIIAVVGFLLIFIKSFTLPLPPRYQYLKYYIWMLLFTSLTSDCLYGDKCLITNVFALYCFQVVYEKSLHSIDADKKEDEFLTHHSLY
ncbi:MAG: hypothetical protein WDO19_29450 [Bacteroidota bacterium]